MTDYRQAGRADPVGAVGCQRERKCVVGGHDRWALPGRARVRVTQPTLHKSRRAISNRYSLARAGQEFRVTAGIRRSKLISYASSSRRCCRGETSGNRQWFAGRAARPCRRECSACEKASLNGAKLPQSGRHRYSMGNFLTTIYQTLPIQPCVWTSRGREIAWRM